MDFFGDLIFVLKKTVPLPANTTPAEPSLLHIHESIIRWSGV
jgi:hypothetical protein